MKNIKKEISIVMGSQSDWKTLIKCEEIFLKFDIPFEKKIISAHRTPQRLYKYATNLSESSIKVVIAGAGGAAHLPGMIASITTIPVIGVPIKSRNSIDGWDSILSILQMPEGVPVATVALDGAANAGILAAQIIAIENSDIQKKVTDYKENLKNKVAKSNEDLK